MTDSTRIKHAKGLYLEGIRDGNIEEALDKHVGERYTQHSTGVANGRQGFKAFFAPFLERTPVRDIQVVRVIEDGQYVFCHVYQSLNNGEAKWVTADLFDTDDEGRLIEHWDVITEFVEETASGRSMIEGPTEVEDLDKTDVNKAIVREFVTNVLIEGKADKIADYISTEQYDQHNPNVKGGLTEFGKHLQDVMASGSTTEYVMVHHLIGQGNFVVIYSHSHINGDDYALFDIFMLKDEKIVEHWDIQEKIGPQYTWNNSGKF